MATPSNSWNQHNLQIRQVHAEIVHAPRLLGAAAPVLSLHRGKAGELRNQDIPCLTASGSITNLLELSVDLVPTNCGRMAEEVAD